jgi:membrane protease YdiL (CAAX protease family)
MSRSAPPARRGRAAKSAAQSSAKSAAKDARKTARAPTLPQSYFQRSELPLTSLLFLLPLLVLYELGTWQFASDRWHVTERRVIAFDLLQEFFGFFRASGRFLPALAVVAIMLAWHILRRDTWRLRWADLPAMALESAVLAAPMILLGYAAAVYFERRTLIGSGQTGGLLVLSIGAGIYEELVFRLIAFNLLAFILVDLWKMPKARGYLLVVFISAVLFAAYHYLGTERFSWRTLAFRTAAGMYFGAIYMTRGFGVTAGTHAAYDLMIVGLGLTG